MAKVIWQKATSLDWTVACTRNLPSCLPGGSKRHEFGPGVYLGPPF